MAIVLRAPHVAPLVSSLPKHAKIVRSGRFSPQRPKTIFSFPKSYLMDPNALILNSPSHSPFVVDKDPFPAGLERDNSDRIPFGDEPVVSSVHGQYHSR